MRIAVIGGSVLSRVDGFALAADVQHKSVQTPFGETSARFAISTTGVNDVVYFNRHGDDHTIPPHLVNYRANMYALKELGVTQIIASAAVGGIRSDMPPLQCVIPDQLIDYSYGREHTFCDTDSSHRHKPVRHIDFSYPFDEALRQRLLRAAAENGIDCITSATYGVTQGPRLESVAEINRMQKDGCDIVGMTAMPEAALARELGMAYATCAIVVNWAAGKTPAKEDETPQGVYMDEIVACIQQGDSVLQKIVNTVLKTSD